MHKTVKTLTYDNTPWRPAQHYSSIHVRHPYENYETATGWSKKTVNCNFIVTGVKFTKYGKTQLFLEMVYREVLIFWCLNNVKWKQSWLSRFCQNSGLAPDWVIHGEKNLLFPVSVCWVSVCAWCSLLIELGIVYGYTDMFQWVLGVQWCLGVCLRTHSMQGPVWLET